MQESTNEARSERAHAAGRQALAMHKVDKNKDGGQYFGLDNWWRSLESLEIRHVRWSVLLHRLHKDHHTVEQFVPGEIEVTAVGEVEEFWSGCAPTRGRPTQLHFNAFFVNCWPIIQL